MVTKLPKKRRIVSDIELARREWCRRNFLLKGLQSQLINISAELSHVPDCSGINKAIAINNRWGVSKGLKIS
jgi:hypothetical protein